MTMGLFGRSKATKAELAQLRATVAELAGRVPAPGVPPPPPRGPSLAEVHDVAVVASTEVARHATQLDEIRARLELFDRRVGEIAQAMTNQLAEFSSELDGLASSASLRKPPVDGSESGVASADDAAPAMAGEPGPIGAGVVTDTSAVDELRAAQIRLANEQARSEMALRSELAGLADLIKRVGARDS